MIGLQEPGPAPPRAPLSGNRVRERTAQAVDYYNTHVHRAWAEAGLSGGARSSFNDRHKQAGGCRRNNHLTVEHLYRSNSSLEILDHGSPTLRREYGSHGSIDVIDRPITGHSQSFFAMLENYQPAVLGAADQRSPGPSEYLRGKVDASGDQEDGGHLSTPQSPKSRVKFGRLFGGGGSAGSLKGSQNYQRHALDDIAVNMSSSGCVLTSPEAEEIARRRAFFHYDIQSLTTNLNYSVSKRHQLARRRNTTTGASAASMNPRSSTPDGETTSDDDPGDGQSNDLILSCPFFRNEIGGEEERIVSLTRFQNAQNFSRRKPLHRPSLAYGVAVLEFRPPETHWTHSTCPYQKLPRPIESVDQGALYYRKYFYGKDHQNWFGMDEQFGPVAISIRREKVLHADNHSSSSLMQHQYRLVIRTSELQTLRGAILEDAIPSIKSSNSSKSLNTKEVLEYVAPEIQLSALRLGSQNPQTEEQLLKLDEQGLNNHYKVGVMYCKAGQSTEEDMYNNEEAGPAFVEFLETMGKTVKLEGFQKYKAGLDTKSNSTGTHSVYAQYQDCEIMFHVSTMLPFTKNNQQQLLRKRHIGNDIVTIVFQEPDALPFTPRGIRSQFQHVFIVVQAINPCTENTHYKVAVSRSKEVQVFGPPIKDGAIFPKGKAFAEFLLAKVVNAENSAHRSEKFVTMATRTRQEYLKELVNNFSTSTPAETGQKFSIFSSKKKEKIRPRFIPDACQRGAILWQVFLDDCGQSVMSECWLGISTDSLVLVEEHSKQIVFVTPCKSILGWTSQTNSLRIYHHQGERITIHIRDSSGDRDELMEIIERLQAVTNGVSTSELNMNRNLMGQLGFHVQPDGVVTLVESSGQAWHAGLKQNSRLVEICTIAVSTLSYDQMVDLLRTSVVVTLTVIPPSADGSPRKGCTLQNCKYNEGNYEGDYETVDEKSTNKKIPQLQQAVPGNHRRVYERSFSPPRSSNSSGYDTGGSSKSFHAQSREGGTLTSSSSGHSGDDKWYDVFPDMEMKSRTNISINNNNNNNNTFPSTPKRNNSTHHQISQLQVSQSHNHFGPQPIHHNKIQISHSLPLQHVNYSQPLTASIHPSSNDFELSYKLEKNNIIKQHNEKIRQDGGDYVMITRAPTLHQINNDFNRIHDSHSTDSSTSERLLSHSEDELSNGSGNVSPRSRRTAKHLSNSRNQSPRALNGEVKLRPGVTPRSSNRNSANLSSSTFNEELLRLIDPDNIEASAEPKLVKESPTSLSRDNLNNTLSVHKPQPEVILTMARPATVISNASTTSSPLPVEFKGSKDELAANSATKAKSVVSLEEIPVPEDWSTLVDTATKVLNQVGSDSKYSSREEKIWSEDVLLDASLTSSVNSSTSVPELQSHVSDLQSTLKRETRRRLSLENEVRRLKEENRKLKDQAQSAVQQLRKFTEWFFKNVQRQ